MSQKPDDIAAVKKGLREFNQKRHNYPLQCVLAMPALLDAHDKLEAENEALRADVATHLDTIHTRDHHEENINHIAAALGLVCEWSNLCDVGEECINAAVEIKAERDTLAAENARLKQPRIFPIQQAAPVPWHEAERAYRTYAKLFGNRQTLERLGERGGFGVQEFSCLWHGHYPEESCKLHGYPDFVALKLEAENARLRERLEAAEKVISWITRPEAGYHGGLPCLDAYLAKFAATEKGESS